MSWRVKLKTRESHLRHRDTEMRTQTQNSKGGRGEGKSQGWIRMSVLMYPWKSVSEIGNPQIISSSLPSLCSSFLSHRHWNLYIQPISRNLYLYELIHKAYLHPSFLNTEVFISNIYIKLCRWNRSSTRTVSFLGSLHMYKNSVSLINSPQGPDDQNRDLYWTLSKKLHGKKNQNNYTYAECICHNRISLLYTEDRHKTSDRLDFNRA